MMSMQNRITSVVIKPAFKPTTPPFIYSPSLLQVWRDLLGEINFMSDAIPWIYLVSRKEQNVLTFYTGSVFQTWIEESVISELLMCYFPEVLLFSCLTVCL